MDKDLDLDGAGLADGTNLLQRQLTRQNDAVIAQRGKLLSALGRVDAHLGRAVQVQRRCNTFDQLRRRQVVRNDGIRPGCGHGVHGVGQAGQLPVIDQRIQRHMHLDAAGMAERHGLPQLVGGKVARRAARVKARQPQINSISAAENSGAKHLAVARRG